MNRTNRQGSAAPRPRRSLARVHPGYRGHRRAVLLLFAAALLVMASARAQAPAKAPLTAQVPAGPISSTPLPEDVTPMRLEDAVQRAQEVSSNMVSAEGSVRIADASHRRAIGSFLPTLNGSAGVNFSSSERFDPESNITVSGASTSVSAGLSASWDLFRGLQRFANLDGARAGQDVARAELEVRRRAITYDTTVAFYEALRVGEALEVTVSRIQRAEAGLEAADKRAKVGAATRSDVLRARLELNSAKNSELQARANRRAAELVLARIVGVTTAVRPVAGPPLLDGGGPSPEVRTAVVDEVLEGHPQITSLRAATRQADANLSAAYGAYWPTLRLSAGTDWFGQEPNFFPGRDSWSVRLGLNLPIFDGFQRAENTVRAKVEQANSRARLAEAERELRSQVERALDQLSLAAEKVSLTDEAVESAREDLRVQQERYGLGVSTMLDLLTSQEALVSSENQRITALFDRDLARAQLEALAGRVP